MTSAYLASTYPGRVSPAPRKYLVVAPRAPHGDLAIVARAERKQGTRVADKVSAPRSLRPVRWAWRASSGLQAPREGEGKDVTPTGGRAGRRLPRPAPASRPPACGRPSSG